MNLAAGENGTGRGDGDSAGGWRMALCRTKAN